MKVYNVLLIVCLLLTSTISRAETSSEKNLISLGYKKSDIVVIVNADDVGIHHDLDRATFQLYDEKKIQDISLMAVGPNIKEAIKMARERNLQVGIHLVLTNDWPEKVPFVGVLPKQDVPSLYNKKGQLWTNVPDLIKHSKKEDVRKEIKAQIIKILDSGLTISHVDTHMFFGISSPKLMMGIVNALEDIYLLPKNKGLKKESLPILVAQLHGDSLYKQMKISASIRKDGFSVADTYKMIYRLKENIPANLYKKDAYDHYLSKLLPGVHHITIHPGLKTKRSLKDIPDIKTRVADFEYWNSEEAQLISRSKNLFFMNYTPLLNQERNYMNSLSTKDFIKLF